MGVPCECWADQPFAVCLSQYEATVSDIASYRPLCFSRTHDLTVLRSEEVHRSLVDFVGTGGTKNYFLIEIPSIYRLLNKL